MKRGLNYWRPGQCPNICGIWLALEILLKVTFPVVGGEERLLPAPSAPILFLSSPRHLLNHNVTVDSYLDKVRNERLDFETSSPTSNYGKYVGARVLRDDDEDETSRRSLAGSEGRISQSPNSANSSAKGKSKKYCSTYLDTCMSRLPPIPDTGIPATAQAVEYACKSFNAGMNCVDKFMDRCLMKVNAARFKASISGAHEIFTFLCRDPKFRAEFLKHGECYQKISSQWDECSRSFIENMKRFNPHGNSTVQCCVRLQFLQCVTEISHIHCRRDAQMFLQKMAETLVRATLRTHVPPECKSIQHENCSMVNSSPSSFLVKFTFISDRTVSHLLNFIIYYTPFAILLLVLPGY